MFKILATIALLCFAFAVPGINFYHHLELPKFYQYKTFARNVFNINAPFFTSKKIDIYLNDEIKEPPKYYEIIDLLKNSAATDTIEFHLIGFGGELSSTTLLINNIRESKAQVIMHVEGPVYSGHAYLAANGVKLIMEPYSFLMFHTSTVINMDCSQETGMDRGVSNQEHCALAKAANILVINDLINDTPLLTDNQRLDLKSGHDVYLFSTSTKPTTIDAEKLFALINIFI